MMTLRQRISIGLGLGILIIGLIVWYLLANREVAPDSTGQVSDAPTITTDTIDGAAETTTPTETVPTVTAPFSEDVYLKQLSKIFVDRFATHSTQNPNDNITDVIELATPTMQAWLRTQTKTESRDYEGVTTEVLASSIAEKTADKATVLIEAQQILENKKAEASGLTNKQMVQRTGKVVLVKVSGVWKIEGLYWDKVE